MPSINDDIAVYSKALDLRSRRHQVLASNVANADTPQYKARDFSFEAAMQTAMAGNSAAGGLGLSVTSTAHLSNNSHAAPAALQYRGETQSSVDGNTVDMDVERSQLTDNALQYQILTSLIADSFKGMRAALAPTQG